MSYSEPRKDSPMFAGHILVDIWLDVGLQGSQFIATYVSPGILPHVEGALPYSLAGIRRRQSEPRRRWTYGCGLSEGVGFLVAGYSYVGRNPAEVHAPSPPRTEIEPLEDLDHQRVP